MIKKEQDLVLCRDMDRAEGHYSQQTNAGTENQIPHVLTYNWELNDENAWTHRGEQNTLGSIRGNEEGTVGGQDLGRDSPGRNARCG